MVVFSYGVLFCQNCLIFWWNMRLNQSKVLPTRCNTGCLCGWFKYVPELFWILFYFLSFLHSCKHVIVQWWSFDCGKILILTFCFRYVPLFHRTQLELGILLNMHFVKREWYSWSSPWLCKWGILVGSYEWQDSGGGCSVGRHPPILTSEQRAGDLTRRFPLPRGGPSGVPSYFVYNCKKPLHANILLVTVQLYKDNQSRSRAA